MKTLLRTGLWTALCVVCTLALLPTVTAQVTLKGTSPKAAEVLSKPAKRVTLFFAQEVNPKKSKLEVYDKQNKRMDSGKLSSPENNMGLSVDLKKLKTGTYTVKWEATPSGGNKAITGTYSFQVQ